eukprot:CAMPEP_0184424504 /NCGR_PEP_ID=MMETSP0738-20130409/111193_1 /TAXON_ID=385413 /ORGANISM="Thalassiosira miniscula, Strain CCMP1093" /LENGTH=86 /DNA_ID=CAMNT_0026786985 /DNA_START=21 /DNA_END=281 /DNA_ORIENTATION=+
MRRRIANKSDNRVTNELVDCGAMFLGNGAHLGKVLVEQLGQFLGLHTFCGGGEIFDVAEENCEFLALSADRHVPLALKDRAIDLRL